MNRIRSFGLSLAVLTVTAACVTTAPAATSTPQPVTTLPPVATAPPLATQPTVTAAPPTAAPVTAAPATPAPPTPAPATDAPATDAPPTPSEGLDPSLSDAGVVGRITINGEERDPGRPRNGTHDIIGTAADGSRCGPSEIDDGYTAVAWHYE